MSKAKPDLAATVDALVKAIGSYELPTGPGDIDGKRLVQAAGVKALKMLAAAWGLSRSEYDVRFSPGGWAVAGNIVLHTDNVYVSISADLPRVLFRQCRGRGDCRGGANQWVAVTSLASIPKDGVVIETESLAGSPTA